MHKKIIGAIISDNEADLGRKKDLIFNLSYFLEKNGWEIEIVSSKYFLQHWMDFSFVYKPITVGNIFSLDGKSIDLPIIVDRADSKTPTLTNVFSRYLIRSAFGQSKKSVATGMPSQVIPLVPPPVELPLLSTKLKNVICFDLKPFHERSTLLSAASILASFCENWEQIQKTLGFKPSFYFTSFFDYESIFEIIDKHKPNVKKPWYINEVRANVIQSAVKTDEYKSILHKSILFITEHGDVADWDVSYCIQIGCKILPYQRGALGISNGIGSVISDAWVHYDDNFSNEISKICKNQIDMRNSIDFILRNAIEESPIFDKKVYENIYIQSLDDCFLFLFEGKKSKIINKLCTDGFKWKKGVSYKEQRDI